MNFKKLLAALALLCGYNPRMMALLGIPLSVIFVLMTDASPSACRAAVMQILILLAPLARRESDPWTSLSAAALVCPAAAASSPGV
jgi:predicted membrane metal-binding protein